MRIELEKGDKVIMLPTDQLLDLFRWRNFFLSDENRIKIAADLGGKTGIVTSIEEKYRSDYFYFLPDSNELHNTYCMPYESVDFQTSIGIQTIIIE